MEWLRADDYWLARFAFQRALAAIYFIGFLVALRQFRPLLGERGLLPVRDFTARIGFFDAPSLFHWRYSDRLLVGVAWSGLILAAAAVLGLTDLVPTPVAMIAWLAMWALYLSIVNVGQVFYSFGWESLLLEAGFLAAFVGNADTKPPLLVLLLLRWLLFRVEFGAGLIKIRGDTCWSDLT